MKILISLLLTFSLSNTPSVKKSFLPYGIVISKADLIVEGTISKVSELEYQLEVNELIKGKSSPSISVQIWNEWTCDTRQKKLKKGQKLMLFLIKEQDSYKVINGSTGELFIEEDNLIKNYRSVKTPTANDLNEAIKMFLKAFSFKGSLYRQGGDDERSFKQLIESSELEKMMTKNEFFKSLVVNIKRYEIR